MTDTLLNRHELATRWGVSIQSIIRLVRKGELKETRIGRLCRYRLADVEAFEDRLRPPA